MLFKKSPPFIGFIQATGLVIYLLLLASFFNFVLPNIPKESPEFYAPVIMLLLFIMSAVISATIVLGRVAVLFWDKHYKPAFTLLGWTLGWMVFYFLMFLFILIL
jgi:hypothetical protein